MLHSVNLLGKQTDDDVVTLTFTFPCTSFLIISTFNISQFKKGTQN